MAFNDLTWEKLGLSSVELTGGYSYTVYNGRGVHVEGHKGVIYMGDEEIVFRIKKGYITVSGEGLLLSELDGYDAYVKGKIKSVFARGENE